MHGRSRRVGAHLGTVALGEVARDARARGGRAVVRVAHFLAGRLLHMQVDVGVVGVPSKPHEHVELRTRAPAQPVLGRVERRRGPELATQRGEARLG